MSTLEITEVIKLLSQPNWTWLTALFNLLVLQIILLFFLHFQIRHHVLLMHNYTKTGLVMITIVMDGSCFGS